MAFPADVTTITLTGKYTDVSGNGLSGTVTFTPSTPLLVDTVGKVLMGAATIAVATNASGAFSTTLLNTSQFSPVGWTWTVAESIKGLTPRSYSISLPSSLGATVDLSAVSP